MTFRLDWSGISFPGGLEDLEKFTRQNPEVQINLFVDHAGKYYQIYKTERVNEDARVIHLLYVEGLNSRTSEVEGHFYPISNINRFGQKYYKAADGTISTRLKNIACDKCGLKFILPKKTSREVLR